MIRPIMRDPVFLSQKSAPATRDDGAVFQDLLDTLEANHERCVGMAANMIGVHKRIIVFRVGPFSIGMYNPVIVKKSGPYETEEGCLSLDGQRKTTRYESIEVSFQDASFRPQKIAYSGYTAQIIQHEMDHCDGVLI